MTSKLALYNGALVHLNERKLSSLSESREPRRVLDDVYDQGIAYCVARGFWNFAMRAVSITPSLTITPAFGFTFAFEKPVDWVRTHTVAENEFFAPPLHEYNDEAGVLYANSSILYARYVSNSASYGLNLAAWTPSFVDYAEKHLAFKAAPRIPNYPVDRIDWLDKQQKRAYGVAAGVDAMDEPPQAPPRGLWVTSRGGLNRGPRSQLLGY
jgi:hypothetical protein